MARTSLSDLHARLAPRAHPGAVFEVRATPGAAQDRIEADPTGPIRIRVTAIPEAGRANEAVRRLLARALGVAPTRLRLIRGETSRDKLFQLDP